MEYWSKILRINGCYDQEAFEMAQKKLNEMEEDKWKKCLSNKQ